MKKRSTGVARNCLTTRSIRRGGHIGTDYITDSGQDVIAISDGTVTGLPSGKYDGIVVGNRNIISYKILYLDVDPTLKVGSSVMVGQTIGIAQDITQQYPGIINHIHVNLEINQQVVNPERYIPSP